MTNPVLAILPGYHSGIADIFTVYQLSVFWQFCLSGIQPMLAGVSDVQWKEKTATASGKDMPKKSVAV